MYHGENVSETLRRAETMKVTWLLYAGDLVFCGEFEVDLRDDMIFC